MIPDSDGFWGFQKMPEEETFHSLRLCAFASWRSRFPINAKVGGARLSAYARRLLISTTENVGTGSYQGI